MTNTTIVSDHFLLKYRELLDAEDRAFDELEHACEDGDGGHYDEDLARWMDALRAKLAFLERAGYDLRS